MDHSLLSTLLPLIAPGILLIYAFFAIQKQNARNITRPLEALSWIGILVAILSGILLYQNGTFQSEVLGWKGLGFAIRLDSLSLTMFTMITILGLVVLRYSINYLDGEPRKNIFFARMTVTIAAVELLVLSGNLVQLILLWMMTSICLHYLLTFYRTRPEAIAAARKKFIVARLGDAALITASILLYVEFGTGDFEQMFVALQDIDALNGRLNGAAILLVITAVLKSAQFPTHGWLIKVVETPTPVSALLHAGLLNAGPFLMVRMSFLMAEATSASLLLIIIAGFTALFASVVYMTQPSVKVALGYSSIAHMGFSLLICGFGVYSAALLHVVAHSFYKAHAFLSSGSVIDAVRARKVKTPKRMGNFGRIGLSIACSLAIFIGFCYLWGIQPAEDFNLMATGAIIVMGLSQVISSTLDSKSNIRAVLQSAGLALVVALAFFSLEQGARNLLGTQIPLHQDPVLTIKIAAVAVLTLYSAIVLIQLFATRINKDLGYALGVHLRNGLYANVFIDRMIGSLKHEKFKWVNLSVQEEAAENIYPTTIEVDQFEMEALPKK
jgi:NAD(P)H-quinone oxidoreductase subunit 5